MREGLEPRPFLIRGNREGMKEEELIRRARDGDGVSIRELYERHAPRVYAVVRRISGDDDLAQDYAQEAWVRAIRALPTFRGEARFSTWLHRIAVNAALQARRKDARKGSEVPALDEIAAPARGRDVLLERRLESCLANLPDGMRRVLVLHDVEGYTHEEIGEVLSINSGTSKSQLFKARAKMRDMLEAPVASGNEEEMEAWSI